ncbi:NTP transferase domain-containing protein [Hoeflea sp.]|uniref:NTP transferase domain-containing protein n=1 Tax=Hoeflea sp. TaxID=1940281 RepID=UPI003BB1C87D
MHFGPVGLDEAEGALLAHALSVGTLRLRKGHVLGKSDLMLLEQAGIKSVIAARLEPGDANEDEAAEALAAAFRGANINAANAATGRVNLHAARAGLFRADRLMVDHLNSIDPGITFACLGDRSQVAEGDMVATIKIIPLAVPAVSLRQARSAIAAPALARVLPFRPSRAGLIATRLPTLKPSVMDKTRELLRERLAAAGSKLVEEIRVDHEATALASEIGRLARKCDLVIVFGASAVTDPDDVIPAAIRAAGGTVERVGMPVDPGNLLVLGSCQGVPVVGAPGCARSPKENGFDWIVARILAGETPDSRDIARMGVGGLLKEIPTRPQPRQAGARGSGSGVSVVLLAAGRSSRMGEAAGHKLLARFDGEPLIRRMTRVALASKARATVVVTGHRADDISQHLDDLDAKVVVNPDYASGMASSLKTGLDALDDNAGGALILLGDMPALTAEHLDALIDAFAESGGTAVIRASDGERRGNPVILPRAAFAEVGSLSGDVGARVLVESGTWPVIDVSIGPSARLDVDTAEAVKAAGGETETSD